MKKIGVLLVSIFVLLSLTACGCHNDKAADAVEDYLNSYKNLSDDVLKSMDDVIAKENLNDEDKETYKEVLKKQYRDLNYTIEQESYDGDTAKVTVKITVYDLYKANKNASDYLSNNPDKFLTEGVYDAAKFIKHKLEELTNMKDTVDYTIVFTVNKKDGKWVVEQPSDTDLEKIHGIYDYENNNS